MNSAARWPRRTLKIGIWTLATLLVVALVASLLGVWTVRRAFPSHDGELALPALDSPVTVYRDQHGVPQIYAETVEDLFRAQGFTHAQDRFWEMDFRRHLTSGRLSELFGPDQVEMDTYLRTMGWRRVAEAEWELLSAETQRYLTAYAEGVDAWVAETGGPAATGRKSLHYRVLGLQNSGYEVAPWDPIDSLAWLKAMAWELRGNLDAEVERAALLAAGLRRDQIDELFPGYQYQEQPPIVGDGDLVDGEFVPGDDEPAESGAAAGRGGEADSQGGAGSAAPAGGFGPAGSDAGVGSNSWVVSGAHTESGAPILVNDPHLGVTMPGTWYQVGLHCDCGYRVSGFSFTGVPGVVIGHNDRIAWGFTNLNPDVTDLYLERLADDRYELDGQWQELSVRTETIRVAGGDDVTVEVRQTHRGPLLSDADDELARLADAGPVQDEVIDTAGAAPSAPGGEEFGFSLAWTALTPGTTIEALFVLNQATGWEDFREAAARFEVPSQNLVYADVDGAIGYQAPGRVPVRAAHDGQWPAPGWSSEFDWGDDVPFEALPHTYNPPEALIVAANQAVVGPQYQPALTEDWGVGYRSNRIYDLLDEAIAAGPITVADMERMVFDNYQQFAPTLVPALLAAAPAPDRDGPEQAAVELLREWDHQQPADGDPGSTEAHSAAAAAYYNAVWRHLLQLTFDELPEDRQPTGRGRWLDVVAALLDEPDSPWWNRLDTGTTETRDDILAQALTDAYQDLAAEFGEDPAQWRWGDLHTLHLRDATFGSSGIGPVESLFNRGPFPVAGGSDIVNATSWDARTDGYEVTVLPSMRMVIDMSDLDSARWIQATGNSGHPYHANYVDQLEPWQRGEMLPWRWERATIEAEAVAELRLSSAGPAG
ncbi:penicillin acylase family protein [Natronosporangium hydrolyticum]|uniref:Penicillin acylase family protein n=1 Tax=Natronosporangium hydrolyticum TaxID=2811111 RepID=A0A895YP08_9ACTN|nr:penicillin acylase family protein [Natronosporangium hydrolyticum]QSB16446.1 penicillin acylase family protein [Natronosporangium hydrolyticum]